MSLGIITKCPEGLVLAAESRVTIKTNTPTGPIHNNFDNAKKLLVFSGPHKHIGAITFGLGSLQLRTAHSFMPEFEASLPDSRISVLDLASQMSDFFMIQWQKEKMPDLVKYKGSPMIFMVAGFNEGEPYGIVHQFNIPNSPKPIVIRDSDMFGVNWGGQREFVDRMIKGYDEKVLTILKNKLNLDDNQMNEIVQSLGQLEMQIPIKIMALQDCINFCNFILQTTISGQELSIGVRGCGGNIDVAVITRTDGVNMIKQKQLLVK